MCISSNIWCVSMCVIKEWTPENLLKSFLTEMDYKENLTERVHFYPMPRNFLAYSNTVLFPAAREVLTLETIRGHSSEKPKEKALNNTHPLGFSLDMMSVLCFLCRDAILDSLSGACVLWGCACVCAFGRCFSLLPDYP